MLPDRDRLRVLLLAEACHPRWASVPRIGYNLARALADRPDLEITLATQVRNREALEDDPIAGSARLFFADSERVARPLYRLGKLLRGGSTLGWTTMTALALPAYLAFEAAVVREFDDDLRRGRFDLVHRITPVSPTIGSRLPSRGDVPTVLGPLNGGLAWPREHGRLWRQEREWLAPLRPLHRLLPYHRSAYRNASAVLYGSRSTGQEIPPGRGLRLYLPENGINPATFPIEDAWKPPETGARFRFLAVGRLVPYKSFDLILRAMAGSGILKNCEVRIIGDGPDRASLEALSAEFGLGECVKFLGWVPQEAVGEELRSAQAFVLPSLREFGGGAVLEAMAAALPAIVVDYGGPGELIEGGRGVPLPMTRAEGLVPLLRDAMEGLATDPARCAEIGGAAARFVREAHTWDAKAETIVGTYRRVLGIPERSPVGASLA